MTVHKQALNAFGECLASAFPEAEQGVPHGRGITTRVTTVRCCAGARSTVGECSMSGVVMERSRVDWPDVAPLWWWYHSSLLMLYTHNVCCILPTCIRTSGGRSTKLGGQASRCGN